MIVATGAWRFASADVPKTGSSSIRAMIGYLSRRTPTRVRHLDLHSMPETWPDIVGRVPTIGFVRNPWDWTASLYAMLRAVGPVSSIPAPAAGDDFGSFVRGLATHQGAWQDDRVDWYRFEDWADGWAQFRRRVGVPLVQPMHVNRTPRPNYRAWFEVDTELIDVVAEANRDLLGRFPYTF